MAIANTVSSDLYPVSSIVRAFSIAETMFQAIFIKYRRLLRAFSIADYPV